MPEEQKPPAEASESASEPAKPRARRAARFAASGAGAATVTHAAPMDAPELDREEPGPRLGANWKRRVSVQGAERP